MEGLPATGEQEVGRMLKRWWDVEKRREWSDGKKKKEVLCRDRRTTG